jgi:hypothetical protein
METGLRIAAWARACGLARSRFQHLRGAAVEARMVRFGEIEVEGTRYSYDLIIDAGHVARRKKKGSKAFRADFGHTPLSLAERIPWGGSRLIVGTGLYGSLPIMPEVYEEAERRGVDLMELPSHEACSILRGLDAGDIYAVLHVTC